MFIKREGENYELKIEEIIWISKQYKNDQDFQHLQQMWDKQKEMKREIKLASNHLGYPLNILLKIVNPKQAIVVIHASRRKQEQMAAFMLDHIADLDPETHGVLAYFYDERKNDKRHTTISEYEYQKLYRQQSKIITQLRIDLVRSNILDPIKKDLEKLTKKKEVVHHFPTKAHCSIKRNGKEIVLTPGEIKSVADEVSKNQAFYDDYDKMAQKKVLAERNRKEVEWYLFRDGDAKTLPYPQNLLFTKLIIAQTDAEAFIDGNEDDKKEIINGVLWAVSILPEENRLAIEYCYRDGMKPKEGGALLGCDGKYFTRLREQGERKLYYLNHPLFRSLYTKGYTSTRVEYEKEMSKLERK